jgi:hypothetical protein
MRTLSMGELESRKNGLPACPKKTTEKLEKMH